MAKKAKFSGTKCKVTKKNVKVCISTKPVPGMKCGKNPKNGLWACAKKGR